MTFFNKIPVNFGETDEVTSLGLELLSLVIFLMKSRSRRFNQVTVSEVKLPTTSLLFTLFSPAQRSFALYTLSDTRDSSVFS